MDSNYNVFKEIELPDTCPPNLKEELVSEIDLIRNSLTLVEVFVDDLLKVASSLVSSTQLPGNSQNLN
ncbi:hypothetical protein LX87_03025 [Larkinella arboricola]|uniref:Uncharacterized protein n=1 Tax=Larkinella arboricola TaxID=643671 RepID=A0A327WXU0_LARAB|nr:hypothetical protein [Larkinella arboricola]RAJ98117.1 hypothetical protein LX87_03025 [Larkinella arboricola]